MAIFPVSATIAANMFLHKKKKEQENKKKEDKKKIEKQGNRTQVDSFQVALDAASRRLDD